MKHLKLFETYKKASISKRLTPTGMLSYILAKDLKNVHGVMDYNDANYIAKMCDKWILEEVLLSNLQNVYCDPTFKHTNLTDPIIITEYFEVLDGRHRLGMSNARGDKSIMAYVGYSDLDKEPIKEVGGVISDSWVKWRIKNKEKLGTMSNIYNSALNEEQIILLLNAKVAIFNDDFAMASDKVKAVAIKNRRVVITPKAFTVISEYWQAELLTCKCVNFNSIAFDSFELDTQILILKNRCVYGLDNSKTIQTNQQLRELATELGYKLR